MAVRKLAGPFTMLYNSGVTPTWGTGLSAFTYLPGKGIVCQSNTGISGYAPASIALVSHDGVVSPHSRMAGSAWAVDPVNGSLRSLGGSDDSYLFDTLGFSPYLDARRFGYVASPVGQPSYVDFPDRRLGAVNFGSAHHIYAYKADGTFSQEIALPGGMTLFGAYTHVGRNKNEIMVASRDTANSSLFWFVFYDAVQKAYSSGRFSIEASNVLDVVYDTDLGVVYVFYGPTSSGDPTPFTMSIFCLDIVPTTVSAVQLIAGSTAQGQVATYRVQVTGSRSEPCVGLVVAWSNSGSGTVIDLTSVTDASGYATCRVLYPLGVTGSANLTATVVF